ncbi:hypothetical protein [Nocardioides sp. 616]|uniref:hypothetical protein n=1 Tax=Nocardioides sp. 616 TaxID=2268090 RepID=UPI000CE484A6|nr:hypothetical protein [Nocardioides sp. 616]
MDRLSPGTPEYEHARRAAGAGMRQRRNQPGGYWVAKEDPHAASEAVTGSAPVHQLRGAALLSNGASRLVDPYGLARWPEAVALMRRADGPQALVGWVRRAESEPGAAERLPRADSPDDATAAYWARMGA